MTTTLEELTTPLTADEVKTAIYDTIAARGTDTTSWKPGAPVRSMIAGVAIVLAAMSSLVALVARSGFLTLSEGPWLTLVARYIYNTERIGATFAATDVVIDNASGNVYAIAVGDLVLLNTTTGATYRNTAIVNIGSAETGVEVPVLAEVAGSAGTASAGQIDDFVTPLLGLTVTNPSAAVGIDEESDADLIVRASEAVGALSPFGPADAYSSAAKAAVRAADGTAIGVNKVQVTPDGNGGITVVVRSATGAVSGTSGDPSTDLGAVHARMERDAVPEGITLTTASAVALTIDVVATAYVSHEIAATDDQIEAGSLARLQTLLADMPIGGVVISPTAGRVYLDTIEAAIAREIGEAYFIRADVTTPAADVEPTALEAPVMGTLDLTIVRVTV